MGPDERLQHLWQAIQDLRNERNHRCSSYLMGTASIKDTCIALDAIGKRSFNYQVMAMVYGDGKYREHSLTPSALSHSLLCR